MAKLPRSSTNNGHARTAKKRLGFERYAWRATQNRSPIRTKQPHSGSGTETVKVHKDRVSEGSPVHMPGSAEATSCSS